MPANAASFRIEETSIAALHAAYLDGRRTALSVCQAHLDRIAAYDRKGPALGAIIINNPDALADAAALDAALASTGKLLGPLHGVPVFGERQLRRGWFADDRWFGRAFGLGPGG
jgi:amidase